MILAIGKQEYIIKEIKHVKNQALSQKQKNISMYRNKKVIHHLKRSKD